MCAWASWQSYDVEETRGAILIRAFDKKINHSYIMYVGKHVCTVFFFCLSLNVELRHQRSRKSKYETVIGELRREKLVSVH